VNGQRSAQFGVWDFRKLGQVAQQSGLEQSIAVDRDRKLNDTFGFP
jgi:hypothetical protein